jgi:hypothetical protein
MITMLFQSVRIFDAKSAVVSNPHNFLVRGNIVGRISASPITVDANASVQRHSGKRVGARDIEGLACK